MNLYQLIKRVAKKRRAVGHFNVCNFDLLKAVTDTSSKLSLPVIIGVSEGERAFLGVEQIVALVKTYKLQGYNIFLNADHTRSLAGVKQAALAGFDSIIFDGAGRSLEDNIRQTKQAVKIVRKINKKILVEGELGYIGKDSVVYTSLPKGAALTKSAFTKVDEAKRFVRETGVDLFAPAVGNIHGMLKNHSSPRLDINLISKIKLAVKIPLVLHGGSGIIDHDFQSAIKAGINIVHISTELRVAWRKGIADGLKKNLQNVVPYKLAIPAITGVEKIIEHRLKLFNFIKR